MRKATAHRTSKRRGPQGPSPPVEPPTLLAWAYSRSDVRRARRYAPPRHPHCQGSAVDGRCRTDTMSSGVGGLAQTSGEGSQSPAGGNCSRKVAADCPRNSSERVVHVQYTKRREPELSPPRVGVYPLGDSNLACRRSGMDPAAGTVVAAVAQCQCKGRRTPRGPHLIGPYLERTEEGRPST
jgi:hypothetical protein